MPLKNIQPKHFQLALAEYVADTDAAMAKVSGRPGRTYFANINGTLVHSKPIVALASSAAETELAGQPVIVTVREFSGGPARLGPLLKRCGHSLVKVGE